MAAEHDDEVDVDPVADDEEAIRERMLVEAEAERAFAEVGELERLSLLLLL